MTKEDRDRAQARADKVARAAQDARSGKAERDASAKAVLDNMAKLRRCGSRARQPNRNVLLPRKPQRRRPPAPSGRTRSRWPCPTGWRTSRRADEEPEAGPLRQEVTLQVSRHVRAAKRVFARDVPAVTKSKVRYRQRYAGPGESIIERVLFSAS